MRTIMTVLAVVGILAAAYFARQYGVF
ncbi:PGF-CTERM sorting domain-containing protein [Acidovorax bellezanensis]